MGLLLLLALGFASAAQAAPGRDYSTTVYMWVQRVSERTICVGDHVPLAASVIKAYEIVGEGPRVANLYGVPLDMAVSDPSIGSLTPETTVTSLQADTPGEARFTFIAKKAGATTITVKGTLIQIQLLGILISSDTVTRNLAVTVEKCEYRVNATAIWHVENITVIATIDEAALAPDEGAEGHYHGNADVKWVAWGDYPPPCFVVQRPASSRAYITGEKQGDYVLEVKVVIEGRPGTFLELHCPAGITVLPLSLGHMLSPEDMRLWVLTSGGSATRHPALIGLGAGGTAVVTVRPEPGQ